MNLISTSPKDLYLWGVAEPDWGCAITVGVFPKRDVHKHHSNHVSDPRQRNDSLVGAPGQW